MLIDITNGVRLREPDEIEEWDVIKKARKIFKEFDEWVEIVDEILDELKPSERSQLVWTKAGCIFGYNTKVDAINDIWDAVIAHWGSGKVPLLFVGSFLMWRVSVRDEQWLTHAQEKGEGIVDPDTGKKITQRSYWINEDFVFKPHNTVHDLMAKFNQRSRQKS
jgi:hypothetical protein